MTRHILFALATVGLVAGCAVAQDPAPPKGAIAERKATQQKRIAKGVKSGELTPHEAAKIERKEAAINKEVRTERKENGGTLTPAQKRQVNRQQNKVSKEIYKEKHDAQKQPAKQ